MPGYFPLFYHINFHFIDGDSRTQQAVEHREGGYSGVIDQSGDQESANPEENGRSCIISEALKPVSDVEPNALNEVDSPKG